jgi:protein LTV1
MPPKKSIYRQEGAQHFQVVHRSVRDPLIHDPEASKHVFRPVQRANERDRAGYTLSDLEASVDPRTMRANEGEAATYGITYDDSAYDYMQHLRTVGMGGGDSVLLEAPKRQPKKKDSIALSDDMFASKNEISQKEAQAATEAIPPELQGFQPDMDPHLRQVLDALSDDEFVDEDGDEDDVFGALLGSGQLEDGEEAEEFEFREWGVNEDDEDARTENGEPREETWEDRFRAFKAAGGRPKVASNGGWDDDDVDSAERSEMADTVGSLVNGIEDMMVRGGKKRHGKRGPSDASGMSMSSSNVYRNDNLRTLDDRFDAIERQYEMDDEDEWDEEYEDDVSIAPSFMSSMSRVSFLRGDEPMGGGPGAPEISRDDFDAIMDDFLDNYEVVGRRMRESLGGTALSGPEKLRVLRSALEDGEEGPGREENRRRIFDLERRLETGEYKDIKESIPRREVEPEAKWDVETILCE